ncbi:MAG: hypothetical protein IPL67_10825 [Ignavibacteria bacterium]|nr:hypothetical protein [Ignavibacteria bacterium]
MNLGSVLQGFYNPVSNSMVLDTITVTLRETVFPYAIVDVADMLLTASGNGTAVFDNASNGVGYYLQLNPEILLKPGAQIRLHLPVIH